MKKTTLPLLCLLLMAGCKKKTTGEVKGDLGGPYSAATFTWGYGGNPLIASRMYFDPDSNIIYGYLKDTTNHFETYIKMKLSDLDPGKHLITYPASTSANRLEVYTYAPSKAPAMPVIRQANIGEVMISENKGAWISGTFAVSLSGIGFSPSGSFNSLRRK